MSGDEKEWTGRIGPTQGKRGKTSACGEAFPGSNYDEEETEFIKAVDGFKMRTGKKFPTLVDLLGVLRELGWRKLTDEQRWKMLEIDNGEDDDSLDVSRMRQDEAKGEGESPEEREPRYRQVDDERGHPRGCP